MPSIPLLKDSGYPRWPYIHNSRDVCFVWYERGKESGRVRKGLHWVSFSRLRSTGKLGRTTHGDLATVMVPSRYYAMSIDELLKEAEAGTPPRIPKSSEWVGPFLYMQPSEPPKVGQEGLAFIVADKAPTVSAGIPLGYVVDQNLNVSLGLGVES